MSICLFYSYKYQKLTSRLITPEVAMIIETLSRICGQCSGKILETLVGLVSREWSLSNAETCLSCQV